MGRSTRTAARRTIDRRLAVFIVAFALLAATTQQVAAASPPANDSVSNATPLTLDVPVEFDSTNATIAASDPTDCNGSHGPWPGPYHASVWFTFTAKTNGQYSVSAPTMQGTSSDFLAISFVYLKTGSGLTLVDCTAFGNEASWPAKNNQTFVIMEAGLDSSVTDDTEFSDRGGHGTIVISRAANANHYHYRDFFTFSDCGPTVVATHEQSGQFRLKAGRQGDPTPYYFDNYEWHTVYTNPANGKWFRADGQGLYRDLHVTKVEGTVYTFVSQEVGRPYTLTDMNGNRLFMDRGRLLTTFQVDTKGDDDLSNDEFIDGSFQLLAENGAHPGYDFNGDFCDIVRNLLG
jgi:hypothetical protein